ncbi:MAG: hypothetical protein DRP12_02530 [Candidatus Aenigmatarchaeota archaeon]|nr:MAG: hypothetical protein DRP12_02530 [Candidatus Aenigmarchaeota archaeon]
MELEDFVRFCYKGFLDGKSFERIAKEACQEFRIKYDLSYQLLKPVYWFYSENRKHRNPDSDIDSDVQRILKKYGETLEARIEVWRSDHPDSS